MATHFSLSFKAGDLLFHHDDDVAPIGTIADVIASTFLAPEWEDEKNEPDLSGRSFLATVQNIVDASGEGIHRLSMSVLNWRIAQRMLRLRHSGHQAVTCLMRPEAIVRRTSSPQSDRARFTAKQTKRTFDLI